MATRPTLKVVLVGEVAVGKTSFARAAAGLPFHSQYQPTTTCESDEDDTPFFDIGEPSEALSEDDRWYHSEARLNNGEAITLMLCDSCGLRDLRGKAHVPDSVTDADAIVLCFSLMCRESLVHAMHDWLPTVRRVQPGVPVFLCGCKADLVSQKRSPTPRKHKARRSGRAWTSWSAFEVDEDDAAAFAARSGLEEYVRCAAKRRRRRGGGCCACLRPAPEKWASPSEVLELVLDRVTTRRAGTIDSTPLPLEASPPLLSARGRTSEASDGSSVGVILRLSSPGCQPPVASASRASSAPEGLRHRGSSSDRGATTSSWDLLRDLWRAESERTLVTCGG